MTGHQQRTSKVHGGLPAPQNAQKELTLRSAAPMMSYSTSAMRSSLGKGAGAAVTPAAVAASCRVRCSTGG